VAEAPGGVEQSIGGRREGGPGGVTFMGGVAQAVEREVRAGEQRGGWLAPAEAIADGKAVEGGKRIDDGLELRGSWFDGEGGEAFVPGLDRGLANRPEEPRGGGEAGTAERFKDGDIVRCSLRVGRAAEEDVAAFASEVERDMLGRTGGEAERLDVAHGRTTQARQRGEGFGVNEHGGLRG
jgi:hypothetical protein